MKLAVLFGSIVWLAVTPVAQAARHNEGAGLLSQLDLTAAQKTEIAHIRARHEPAKLKRAQVLAVLTTGQKAQLRSLLAQRET